MPFFVVERGGAGADLRMPMPQAFATREAALEALSAAVSAGTATLDGEIFVVDLDAAVPVLFMPGLPAQATGVQEQAVPEAPPPAEEVYASWAEAVVSDETAEEAALADALKRAAFSLESEGIVAPDSIESAERAAERVAWDSGAPAGVAEPAGASELAPAEAAETDSAAGHESATDARLADLTAALEGLATAGLPVDSGEGAAWPWANVTPVDETEAVGEASAAASEDRLPETEPRDLIAETVASLEQESAEAVSLLTPVAEGEEVFVPKPVILGDYDETPVGEEPVVLDEVEGRVVDTADARSVATDETPADVEAAVEPEVLAAADVVVVPTEDEASAAPGYEGGGELDLAQYTCDDCVYANTCPKVGQSTPADCGSFQWKSD